MEFNATFIVSAISFIVFTIIMNAIFYKPLSNVVAERQKFIDDTLQEAKHHSEKASAIIKDKETKLENTRRDAKKIILDKTEEVKTKKSELASEAQKNAAEIISTKKEELQKSEADAKGVLSEETKNLAQEISSKILGKV